MNADALTFSVLRTPICVLLRLSAAISLLLGCLASSHATLADGDPPDDATTLFKDKVRPLFERKCFDCHSSKAEELKGELKLETVEQILKGGATGPAVIAGDVEDSFLLRSIRYQEDDFQMPPAGKMTDEEIAEVEKWVKALNP
jgi:mono/diheme cytochrome c family protein